jgi:hypothetical protein
MLGLSFGSILVMVLAMFKITIVCIKLLCLLAARAQGSNMHIFMLLGTAWIIKFEVMLHSFWYF